MKTIWTTILLSSFVTTAIAHDYWISPTNYRPMKGEAVPVQLFVGDHFKGEVERELSEKMTVDFHLYNSEGTADILDPALYGKKPIGKPKFDTTGTNILSIQRNWARIEMEGPKFHKYLEHEGLTDIIKQRNAAGEQDQSATERYRRYLKSLVVVGGQDNEVWKKRLGHKLEILPLSNPSTVPVGGKIGFQVILDDEPLSGVQLAALGKSGDKVLDSHTRTDAQGKAFFKLNQSGVWMVRLVHLRKCSDESADWESFWSSLTFRIDAP
ncbi:MAG: DUF4198 domain-containing protein [Planctomycetota bacterium]|nr:DUF4198 domain-containing protein [Planctomycetota bacterium]